MRTSIRHIFALFLGLLLLSMSLGALAHGVDDDTRLFLEQNTGTQFFPFIYIGAKHMFTGYDHISIFGRRHIFPIPKPRCTAVCQYVYDRPQHYLTLGSAG